MVLLNLKIYWEMREFGERGVLRLFVALYILCIVNVVESEAPATVTFACLTANTILINQSSSEQGYVEERTAFRLAVEDINANNNILPNTQIQMLFYDTQLTEAGALSSMVNASRVNVTGVIGPKSSDEAVLSAIGGSVYEVAQISYGATLAKLSREFNYPFFSRVVPSDDYQAKVFIDILEYLYNTTNRSEWLNVSIICTSDSYGVDGSKLFINLTSTATPKITVSTFQQFLPNAESVYEEVHSLKQSKVRVFLAYMVQRSFKLVLQEALQQHIVGDQFAWLCSDGCTTDSIFYDASTRSINKLLLNGARGLIGVVQRITSSPLLQPFIERWEALDPNEYEGAGTTPSEYVYFMYDATYTMAHALHLLYERNEYSPTAFNLTNEIRNISFEGVTGVVNFDLFGDRVPIFNILNLQENGKFVNVGEWTIDDELNITSEFFFHDQTNDIDLDYQEAFDYWSCSKKESYTDKTGKTVDLESVDGDPDDIDIKYECDLYVDCNNSSDEGPQCSPSRIIGYIVIGVIAGCIFILFLTIFLPFVIIFSLIIPRKRVYYSGIFFMLILILSSLLGLTSVYPFFGKASNVACGFQVWILGLSSNFLICALFSKQIVFFLKSLSHSFKNFPRLHSVIKWLIHRQEIHFLVWFCITSIIGILILVLWTIISTPIADLLKADGEKHYLCSTGGTGPPGGLVFFFILFGYLMGLCIIGFIITFATRNFPYKFGDSRFTSISIFNVAFTLAVVTTIVLLLDSINAFASWIILLIGIIYGFSSTIIVCIVPKMIGLVIIDKFENSSGEHRKEKDDYGSYSGTSGSDEQSGSLTL